MRKEGLAAVAGLLQKYKQLKAPQGTVIEVFLVAVKDVCGLELKRNAVAYRPGSRTLSVSLMGPMKHEVLLHQKAILAHCEAHLGRGSTPSAIV